MDTFAGLGLDARITRAIASLGFTHPTPIQAQVIPALLDDDRDLIGLAGTGTGKTAAFGLPLLSYIDTDSKTLQALILSPTRELCKQIVADFENFSKYMDGYRQVAVYGGADISSQIRSLKQGPQVVVATPGRLMDLIGRKAIKLDTVHRVVLDEADEMLNLGFKDDIDEILSMLPEEHRTWLFSATMPKEIRDIAKNYMEDPLEFNAGKISGGADGISHEYYLVKSRDRYAALKRTVDAHPDIFGIVFCRTRAETQEVAEHLIKDGYNADSLHGDLSQAQRDKVMKRYRDRSLQLLIATDVAARGIDVKDVTHVIHYNLPDELENYLHRSGRTARAGRTGVSLAIVSSREMSRIRQIEKETGRKFIRRKVPDGIRVCEVQLLNLIAKIHSVEVNHEEIEPYLPAALEELHDLSREELITRILSIEFNRFLEYYRDAPDLNTEQEGKPSSFSSGGGSYRSKENTLFINVGSKDGLDKGRMLRLLCETAGVKGSVFGRIDVKGVYSFVDVEPGELVRVKEAMHGTRYAGRTVRVEIQGSAAPRKAEGAPVRKKSFSSSPSRSGNRKERYKSRG